MIIFKCKDVSCVLPLYIRYKRVCACVAAMVSYLVNTKRGRHKGSELTVIGIPKKKLADGPVT